MTTKGQLRDLIAGILDGATDAGPEVYTPADWPTYDGEYPVILVSAPSEDKQSYGTRGAVEFLVTATIRIVGKVEMAAFSADFGAELAEAAVERLQRQIERQVIGNPSLDPLVSQYAAVRSAAGVSAEGEKHIAVITMELDLEFYQGPDLFWDPAGLPLTEVAVHVDAENIFDPNGVYPNPPFPAAVVPAPRSQGPDGRDEGALLVTLPTE